MLRLEYVNLRFYELKTLGDDFLTDQNVSV